MRCPLCAAPAPPPAFVKAGYPITRCACGMVFVAREVDPAVLDALYGESYFAGGFETVVPGYRGYADEEPVMRRNFDRRLALIERRVAPGGGRRRPVARPTACRPRWTATPAQRSM